MSNNINLLSTNNHSSQIVPVKRLTVMRSLAVGMLFVVSVSAVVLFILVALSPLPELRRQEQSLRFTLSQSHTVMGKLDLLDERLGAIKTILKDRSSADETIATVQSALPKDVTVTSFRIDKELITVSASSKSLQSLDTFLNGLIKLVADKNTFSQVKMTDLTSEYGKGSYSVTIELVHL